MTDRGLPIADGASACPFVAFAEDRDERASSPDHRHRCYAETQPAPRALAHQEAYCLSSAFPVCPTFQDWARREAARERSPEPGTGLAMGALQGSQRNPPRAWTAPPPWLSGEPGASDASTADGEVEEDEVRPIPARGGGLAGSFADRVASGDVDASPGSPVRPTPPPPGAQRPDPVRQEAAPPARPAPAPSSSLGGSDPTAHAAPSPSAAAMAAAGSGAAGSGAAGSAGLGAAGSAGSGVAATGALGSGASHADQGGARRHPGAPGWERPPRMEAYPTIRSRRLSEISISPILIAFVALLLASAVLFLLPGLLGFGGPGGPVATATPTPAPATTLPSLDPTPVPQPTQQVYIVQPGDTMSKIAGKFGIPLQTLIDANAANIPDPNKLQIGDQVIIPSSLPTEIPGELPGSS